MSLTKRQGWGLIVLWAVVSAGLGLLGPFGTFDLLGPLMRLAYWSFTVGASIVLWLAQDRVFRVWRPTSNRVSQGISAAAYALCLAALLSLVHLWVFPGWAFWPGLLWLCVVILAVQAVIYGIRLALRLMLHGQTATPNAPDPTAHFLARLPIEKRGALIRLESEDHYIRAFTTKGEELLLLRLSDAEKELGDAGWRVHRSHWIARGAITWRRSANGQTLLVTRDGAEIPVGRSYRPTLKAAGVL